jgi:hypothetical protein
VEYLSSIIFQPETPILRQETPIMMLSWRDLSYDKDAGAHIEDHFCRRGSSDKDLTKPSRSILLQLLLKDKVTSGKLIIDRFEDGVPIIIRGRAHVSEDIDHPEDTGGGWVGQKVLSRPSADSFAVGQRQKGGNFT